MRIVIPGDPIAKARHRAFIRNGHVATYDPQIQDMNYIRLEMNAQRNDWRHETNPLNVHIEFHLDALIGASKALSNLRQWASHFPIFDAMATKRIDLDNLCKTYLDCGNEILWSDDRFIVQLSCRKLYSKIPCTIITVETIKEVKMEPDHEKVFKLFNPEDCETMSADAERIYMSIPVYKFDDSEVFDSQMAAAAELLIDFADEWADKLKKLKRKG